MKIALGIKNLRRLLTGAVGPTPVNTVAPAVTGTLNQGDTLTTTNGTWNNTPTSFAYQWYSNSANSTVGATAISGATAATFVINVAVGAQYIFCRVTAINTNGANNAPSNIVGPTVAVVLGTLALSSTSFTNGTTASGTITGATSGSTIALANGPAGFTINSAARTWAFDGSAAVGSGTLTLTETLTGATGSPKANSIGWGVSAAGSAFPATVDSAILSPSLALASAQTAYPIQFTIGSLGDAQSGHTIWLERRDSSLTVVDYFSHLLTDADMAAISGGVINLTFSGLSAITTGTWRWYAYRQVGTSRSNASVLVISGPDDIAPTITTPTTSNIQSSAATVGATTDEANGTLYGVLTLVNTAPTAVQVEAGQNSAGTAAAGAGSLAVSAIGALTFTITGLPASTTLYLWLMQKDAASNRSTVLSGGSITTTAAVTSLGWDAATGTGGTSGDNSLTLTNGGKTVTMTTAQGLRTMHGLQSKTSGIRFLQYAPNQVSGTAISPGLIDTSTGNIMYWSSNGSKTSSTPWGAGGYFWSPTGGDLLGFEVNFTAQTIAIWKNAGGTGTWTKLSTDAFIASFGSTLKPYVEEGFAVNCSCTIETAPVLPSGVASGCVAWGAP